MQTGFEVVGAKSKKAQDDDAPAQVSMSRQQGLRRNPTGDQKKVRTQQARNVRTASVETPDRHSCPNCGKGMFRPSMGHCAHCGFDAKKISQQSAFRARVQAGMLEDIRDNDPDGGETEPTDEDYTSFNAWIEETYGEDALRQYRGRSEDTLYDPSAEDDIPGAGFHAGARKVAELTWTEVGQGVNRGEVMNQIAQLNWLPITDSMTMPMMPGMAINSLIKEFNIPKVTAVAHNGILQGRYGFYGIEGNYANGRVRVYVKDDGSMLTPVASELLDATTAAKTAVVGSPKVVQVPEYAAGDQGLTYDWTQTSDDLSDGDVFVGNGFTGFLMQAWPILVSGEDQGILHGVENGFDQAIAAWKSEGAGDYGPSYELAKAQHISSKTSVAEGNYEMKRSGIGEWIDTGSSTNQGALDAAKSLIDKAQSSTVVLIRKGDSVQVYDLDTQGGVNSTSTYESFFGHPYTSSKTAVEWYDQGSSRFRDTSEECMPGGSGQCDGNKADGGFCDCPCHNAMEFLNDDGEVTGYAETTADAKRWHDMLHHVAEPGTKASKTAAAPRPSMACPNCGTDLSPHAMVYGDTLLARCPECDWRGTKRKTSSGQTPKGGTSTCKQCGATLTWDGQQYQDAKGEVSCPKGGSHQSAEEYSKAAARSDYDHWNEDADYMWYQEEGRFPEEPPEPDDYDIDDRDYEEDDEDEDDDEPIGDPKIPEHQLGASRKERTTMTTPIHREAQILRALAVATPEEQVRLLADLEALRSRTIASHQALREADMDDTVIAAHLTPVTTHSYHTAATDWMEEMGAEEPDFDVNALLTEAALWFRRVSNEVRADRDEFAAQAQGYAVRIASQFGVRAPEAARTFLDRVAHLHRTAGTETGDNANAISALPDEVPLEGHTDVLDNFQPLVDPVNAGITPEDVASTRAPNVTSSFDRVVTRRQGNLQVTSATCADCGAAIERDPKGETNRTWHHNDGSKHDHEAKPGGGDKESRRVTAEGDTCPARSDGGDHLYGSHDGKCRLCGADYDKKEGRRVTAALCDGCGQNKADAGVAYSPSGGMLDLCDACLAKDPNYSRTKTSVRSLAVSYDDAFLFEADVIADPSGEAQSGLPQVDVGGKNDREGMWPWEIPEGDTESGKDAADVGSTPTPGQKSEDYPQPKGAAKIAAENCGSCGHHADSHNQGPNADECGCGCSYFHKSSALHVGLDDDIDDKAADAAGWGSEFPAAAIPTTSDTNEGWAHGPQDAVTTGDTATATHHQAGSDDFDHGESDEGDDKGYWGDEPDFDSFEDDADHEGGGWVEGPVVAPMIGRAANRPVPLTPTQAAFRERIRRAAATKS